MHSPIQNLTIKAKLKLCFALLAMLFAAIAVVTLNTPQYAGSQRSSSVILVGLALFGVIVAVIMGMALYRAVLIPLDRAIGQMTAIAQGNLSQVIPVQRGPRLGRLEKGLMALQDSTRLLVREMQQAAGTVDDVARQISQESSELALRTELQLELLQNSAASIEQITATVTENAAHAGSANQMVQDACTAAGKGLQVIGDVTTTMAAIEESSREIVDIVGVIDAIAFQTNILALNAAVEAARAGEQGRGFAVVASEVRTLAQRCSTAAREIKVLITNSAQRVSTGNALVSEAGKTMSHIVEAIQNGTHIMTAIATASREQSSGIADASAAIQKIDEMAQQNASHVNNTAAVSQSMEDQVKKLLAIVAPFRLN